MPKAKLDAFLLTSYLYFQHRVESIKFLNWTCFITITFQICPLTSLRRSIQNLTGSVLCLFLQTFSLIYRKNGNPILKQNVYLRRVVAGVLQIACFAICNLWLQHIIFLLWIHDHLIHQTSVVPFSVQNCKKSKYGTVQQRYAGWYKHTWTPLSHNAKAVAQAILEGPAWRKTCFASWGMLLSTTAVAKPLPSTRRTLNFEYFCLNSSPPPFSCFACAQKVQRKGHTAVST